MDAVINQQYRKRNQTHTTNLDEQQSKSRVCCRSEEHTSELQSRLHLVCRLLLEKKKNSVTHVTLTLFYHFGIHLLIVEVRKRPIVQRLARIRNLHLSDFNHTSECVPDRVRPYTS